MKLEIELVPATAWYSNLRKAVRWSVWEKIRKQSYADAGHVCGICKAGGRLNCHEIWHYDDDKHIQTLKGFIALCDKCHWVKHIGLASIFSGSNHGENRLDFEAIVKHFMKVNDVDRETFERHEKESFKEWSKRSKHEWTTNLSKWAPLVDV